MTELSRYDERRTEKTDVPLDSPKALRNVAKFFYDSLGYDDNEFMSALSINKQDFDFFILNRKTSSKMRIAV
jgi:hypothetical protein